jgi:hypothetical protein
MSLTYAWEITQLDCYSEHEGLKDVVYNVGWARSVEDGTHAVCNCGSQRITIQAAGPFIPFGDLTPTEVLKWVENEMGAERLAQLDADLAGQLAKRSESVIISPPLPWAGA